MHNDLAYGLVCYSLIIATFIHLNARFHLAFPGGNAEPQVSVYANSEC